MLKNKCREEIAGILKCYTLGVSVQARACTVQRESSKRKNVLDSLFHIYP